MSDQISFYMREFGTILIALGVALLITGLYTGLMYYVWELIINKDYAFALIITSASLIVTGGILKLIFKRRRH